MSVDDRQFQLSYKRLKGMLATIKEINEQGRVASRDPAAVKLFKGMFQTLDKTYSEFNESWNALEESCFLAEKESIFPTDADVLAIQKVAKDYYFEAYSNMEVIKASSIPSTSDNSFNNSQTELNSSSRARLPRIVPPKFDGVLSNWMFYKSMFSSLIADDLTIPDVEKYNLLISSLSGEALAYVKTVPSLGSNFNRAWKLLTDKYDNKRKLAALYIENLINLKHIGKNPSATDLLNFSSTVREHVSSFLEIPIAARDDFILFTLAIRALDSTTREAFELENTGITFPKLDTLLEFVNHRQLALSLASESSSNSIITNDASKKMYPRRKPQTKPTSVLLTNSGSNNSSPSPVKSVNSSYSESNKRSDKVLKCFICKNPHLLKDCPTFIKLPPQERLNKLKSFNGCRNCFNSFHRTRQCLSKYSCRNCHQRHNTMLCTVSGQGESSRGPNPQDNGEYTTCQTNQQIQSDSSCVDQPRERTTCTSVAELSHNVLLATAMANMKDVYGKSQPIRMVLDSGGQSSFITQDLVNRLGLKIQPLSTKITGVGSSPVTNVLGKVVCTFGPIKHPSFLKTEAIVVPKITSQLPQVTLPSEIRCHYQNYELADEGFWMPRDIDFLLGAGMYTKVVLGAPFSIHTDAPDLMNTIFGHVLMGGYSYSSPAQSSSIHFTTYESKNEEQFYDLVKQFWEIEELSLPKPLSPADQYCEDHFKLTHYRMPDGRYVVSLPFKSNVPELGPSKHRALKRFTNLESKLSKDSALRDDYHKFMKEYEDLNHMSESNQAGKYYIPHHSVLKITGDKRKIRVVFDGSASTSTGSLNDHLLAGPKLQMDICIVTLNFRRHKVVICTDIVKMFRQVLINPTDRAYTHILWRYSPDEPIKDYELNTITYGLKPSPYLSLRTLHQLKEDEGVNFPLAAEVLNSGCYVDDINFGAESPEDALIIQNQLVGMLNAGGFALSKWASNCPEVLQALGEHTTDSDQFVNLPHDDESNQGIKILGLWWNPHGDFLSYKVDSTPVPNTKRGILSTVARTFDPLGYAAPAIFYAKCIMQQTWKCPSTSATKSTLGWDDPLPSEIVSAWQDFYNDLPNLAHIRIQRHIPSNNENTFRIVGFSDASIKGYGAVIYLIVQQNLSVESHILKSKTRLAPVKTLSVPRLELCGALLLARLYSSLKEFFKHYEITSFTFFTDSSVVLGWLHSTSDLLKTFVSHRVGEILSLTKLKDWRHVVSEHNPADIASRGTLPSNLLLNTLWWHGPSWLLSPFERWPMSLPIPSIEELPEIKTVKVNLLSSDNWDHCIKWMERFSKYPSLIRSMAFALRFLRRKTLSKGMLTAPISAVEFRESNAKCVRILQQHFLSHLFDETLRQKDDLHARLNTFVDPQGLIRVGGRLRHSDISYAAKHPLLLPRRCHFNNILIDWYHQIYYHAGPATLQSFIQQTYWIPAARSLIKSRKKQCSTCLRLMIKPEHPYMGDLPHERLSSINAFHNAAVDFAGPLLCKTSERRNASTVKSYICLFVCCSTKALHLELVPSLSTNEFLNSFDKFVYRRGLPAKMLSDCGSNFKGTANYLKEVAQWHNENSTQSAIVNHVSPKGITWIFNPPRSPHFGGLWESGVKVTKTLLRRTFGNQSYTLRELDVMLTRVEGILNSRPLYPESSDPQDLKALTPGHFLVGRAITATPEMMIEDIQPNRLSRWEYIRQRTQEFWRRWRTEYLYTLQQRVKWLKKSPNIAVGHLVLLLEDNVPPLQWPLGRITEVFPGKDDIIRVVSVKTATGIYKRPAVKVVSLSHLHDHINDKGAQ